MVKSRRKSSHRMSAPGSPPHHHEPRRSFQDVRRWHAETGQAPARQADQNDGTFEDTSFESRKRFFSVCHNHQNRVPNSCTARPPSHIVRSGRPSSTRVVATHAAHKSAIAKSRKAVTGMCVDTSPNNSCSCVQLNKSRQEPAHHETTT